MEQMAYTASAGLSLSCSGVADPVFLIQRIKAIGLDFSIFVSLQLQQLYYESFAFFVDDGLR